MRGNPRAVTAPSVRPATALVRPLRNRRGKDRRGLPPGPQTAGRPARSRRLPRRSPSRPAVAVSSRHSAHGRTPNPAPEIKWDGNAWSVTLPAEHGKVFEAKREPGLTYVVRIRETGTGPWSIGFATPIPNCTFVDLKPDTEYECWQEAETGWEAHGERAATGKRASPLIATTDRPASEQCRLRQRHEIAAPTAPRKAISPVLPGKRSSKRPSMRPHRPWQST